MSIQTPVETIVIPSSPADLKKIKGCLQEISDSMTRIEAEKDFIKEAIAVVAEEQNLPKTFISKLAKTYHKRSFEKEMSEVEAFEIAYQTIVGKSGETFAGEETDADL